MDDETRMLICGFNNRAHKLFPQDIPYYNIPSVVNHICLLFYGQIERDYFAVFDAAYIQLSDDKKRAQLATFIKPPDWITIYGNMTFDNELFPNTIIEYDITAIAKHGYFGAIGIVSAAEEQQSTGALIWSTTKSKHKQAYTLHLSPYSNMYQIGNAFMEKKFGYSFIYEEGEKIKMIVNIPDKSVTFSSITKGVQIGSYSDIDFSIKYRIAVSIDPSYAANKSSVELSKVKFTQKRA